MIDLFDSNTASELFLDFPPDGLTVYISIVLDSFLARETQQPAQSLSVQLQTVVYSHVEDSIAEECIRCLGL